ncbi:MAG: hypothetical protein ABSH09_14670 [Bryobacteraceae bacterium]|jgi:hypothetical protein
MALLLRTVDKDYRWFKKEAAEFLAADDSPADPIADLRTDKNRLSVYVISDDRSNLERIVRAVAVGRQRVDHAAYVVFDSKVVEEAGIEIEEVPGTTKDVAINDWHRDLVLSGKKLAALAKGILRDGEDVSRILKERMVQLVVQGIKDGELPEECKEKLTKK